MSTRYIQGTTITAKAEFRNSAGALFDPAAVYFKYKKPDLTVVTKSYALSEITKTSVGLYEIAVTLDQGGVYYLRWEGTGTNGTVNETSITVIASKVV